jgi:hypothetical protein
MSPVISGNGDVIFFDYWNVYSVDTEGNQNWRCPITGFGGLDSAIDAEGTIYLMAENTLYAINSRPLSLTVFSLINIAFLSIFIPLVFINSRLMRTKDRERRGPILLLYAGGLLLLINSYLFVFLINSDSVFLYRLG